MRRIVKRDLVRDPSGRALSVRSERLTDDGEGSVQVTSERSAEWCSGCRRPVADPAELRGVCDWCRSRGCCVHCMGRCQVCSRRLCGTCRRGFAGPPPLTVCPACQQRLVGRQVLQDREAAFQQELLRHRLLQEQRTLQLSFERLRWDVQLQAARLGLRLSPPKISFPRRLLRGARWVASKVVQPARRALPGEAATGGISAHRRIRLPESPERLVEP